MHITLFHRVADRWAQRRLDRTVTAAECREELALIAERLQAPRYPYGRP